MALNVWTFVGNLGQDAETRVTPKGDSVVSFSVGVQSGFGDKATTTWARCSMFGKRGEAVSPYLLKGQQVAVSGELSTREWNDKNGQTRTSVEVRVAEIQLVGKRDGQQQAAPRQQAPRQQSGGSAADMDDDIPFANIGRGMAAHVI